jgi:general secretion pathway protein G
MQKSRVGPHFRDAGFTLLELLVVLAILALLAGIATPAVIGYLSRAKVEAAEIQIQTLAQTLDHYRLDVGGYPTQAQGLEALVAKPAEARRWSGPYLTGGKLPLDPWGRPYVYRAPGAGGRAYDLYSLGADGAEGGEGENADVGRS